MLREGDKLIADLSLVSFFPLKRKKKKERKKERKKRKKERKISSFKISASADLSVPVKELRLVGGAKLCRAL